MIVAKVLLSGKAKQLVTQSHDGPVSSNFPSECETIFFLSVLCRLESRDENIFHHFLIERKCIHRLPPSLLFMQQPALLLMNQGNADKKVALVKFCIKLIEAHNWMPSYEVRWSDGDAGRWKYSECPSNELLRTGVLLTHHRPPARNDNHSDIYRHFNLTQKYFHLPRHLHSVKRNMNISYLTSAENILRSRKNEK